MTDRGAGIDAKARIAWRRRTGLCRSRSGSCNRSNSLRWTGRHGRFDSHRRNRGDRFLSCGHLLRGRVRLLRRLDRRSNRRNRRYSGRFGSGRGLDSLRCVRLNSGSRLAHPAKQALLLTYLSRRSSGRRADRLSGWGQGVFLVVTGTKHGRQLSHASATLAGYRESWPPGKRMRILASPRSLAVRPPQPSDRFQYR